MDDAGGPLERTAIASGMKIRRPLRAPLAAAALSSVLMRPRRKNGRP